MGASGSDKTSIQVSETTATPGYRPCRLAPGEWQIMLGAYKVAEEGVHVTYELTFTPKRLRLLKGDLHVHTLASDGVLTAGRIEPARPGARGWISWQLPTTTRWLRRTPWPILAD